MKLSEAIMLGRHLVKPVSGGGDEAIGEGCALTMAVRATGKGQLWEEAQVIWPDLANMAQDHKCPHCPARCVGVQDLVIHLFDTHVMGEGFYKEYARITLEQLVDYIKQFEPAADAASTPEVSEPVQQEVPCPTSK